MDLPRDGPDRPACIVMWYSAPLAEELCEGYKKAQHARDRKLNISLRWDSPISGRQQGKKLVECSRLIVGMQESQKQVSHMPLRFFSHMSRMQYDHCLPDASILSSTRMSLHLQHSIQQPLSWTALENPQSQG